VQQIIRVKINWSGFQGAPGLTALYFRDFAGGEDQVPYMQQAVTKTELFTTELAKRVPSGVTLQVATDCELLNAENGDLLDVRSVAVAAAKSNASYASQPFAAAAGAVINWRTGSVHRGRRVKGRSFIVPLAGNAFEANGTLHPDTVTTLQAGATALLNTASAPDFGVWARPQRTKNPDGSTTLVPNGQWYVATSSNVPDMSAVMRSRRS
jgi:hypothetical protein